MAQVNAKIVMSDPAMRALLKIDNYIAVRDLTIRVIVEIFLIWLINHLIQDGSYFFVLCLFYLLAIWHSFWGYAGIGHELMHGRVFSDKRVNSALYFLSSSLVWSNPAFFKDSHHHHTRTFSEDDAEAKGVQKWGAIDILFYTSIDIPFMIRRLFYTIVNSFGFKYVNGEWHNITEAHQIAALITLLLQITICIIIYYLTQDFLLVLLWILLPFTGQLINKLLAQSQHMGLMTLREFGPLSYSRSIKLPKLLTFLYAGMNYHAEHHLIPSIPYYNLEKASEFLVRFYDHQVVDWRRFYKNDFLSFVRNS